jgi:thymidylate kinase
VSRGFDISLLGMDGIGKSTLAAALARRLRAGGREVSVVSWQDFLRSAESGPGARLLGGLYGTLIRSLYAGTDALDRLPGGESRYFGDHGVRRVRELDSLRVGGNRPRPLLAAALLETAAQLLARELVVEPALARGEVVIQDGHGLKIAVKALLLAEAGTAGRPDPIGVELSRLLGRWAEPSLGVFLTGDPEVAHRRKNGTFGFAEHFGLVGGEPDTTFVPFQRLAQERYAAAAREHGWLTVPSRSLPDAVEAVLTVLRGRGFVAEVPA